MEFNELEMIRDSQNQKPLDAVRVIQHQNENSNRPGRRCFAAEITVGVVYGGLILVGAGMLSFGDLVWAWLGTLPWVEVAALTAGAIAKRRRRPILARAIFAQTLSQSLTKEEQSYGV